MNYILFGRTGVHVSPICVGTGNLGLYTDEGTSIRIMHAALDRGVNFIDTANAYNGGVSEEIVGKTLDGGRRTSVFLATKFRTPMGKGPLEGGASRRHIMEQVDGSLRRLRTDWIDLYQIHWPDLDTPLDETIRALDDLVRMGKVNYVGTSNHPGWLIVEGLWASERERLVRFASDQSQYNMIRRGVETSVFPVCAKYGLGFLGYSPLAGGWLSGTVRRGKTDVAKGTKMGDQRDRLRTPEGERRLATVERLAAIADEKGISLGRLALAWVRSSPVPVVPIVGPRTMEQMEDSIAALDVTIADEDRKRIDEIVPPSGNGD